MSVVSFRLAQEPRSAEPVRALLTAQAIYEQVRAARRTFVSLLAAVGGILWIALAFGVAPASPFRYVGIMAWSVTLALVIGAGALELLWRRRRDLAAASLPRP